jgi:hypothetical protein
MFVMSSNVGEGNGERYKCPCKNPFHNLQRVTQGAQTLAAHWVSFQTLSKKGKGEVIPLYLHRALNKVTQSANQYMHTFNFLFIKTYLKFLKALLHVSVIRPSSGSLSSLLKSL